MTTKEYKKMEKLSKEAEKAIGRIEKIHSEIRIALSMADIKTGRVKKYKNTKDFLKTLKIS